VFWAVCGAGGETITMALPFLVGDLVGEAAVERPRIFGGGRGSFDGMRIGLFTAAAAAVADGGFGCDTGISTDGR